MKITKNASACLITAVVILAVVNIVAFVFPFERSGGFWCGYSFITALVLLMAAVAVVSFVGVNIGREEIRRIEERVQEKVFYSQSLQEYVTGMAAQAEGDDLRKALNDLAETVRYSDPMSHPQLAALENQIEVKVAALGDSIGREAQEVLGRCDELQQLFAERNRKCRLMK